MEVVAEILSELESYLFVQVLEIGVDESGWESVETQSGDVLQKQWELSLNDGLHNGPVLTRDSNGQYSSQYQRNIEHGEIEQHWVCETRNDDFDQFYNSAQKFRINLSLSIFPFFLSTQAEGSFFLSFFHLQQSENDSNDQDSTHLKESREITLNTYSSAVRA